MLGKAGMSCEKWLSVKSGKLMSGKVGVSQNINEVLRFGKDGTRCTRTRSGNGCSNAAELRAAMSGEATFG